MSFVALVEITHDTVADTLEDHVDLGIADREVPDHQIVDNDGQPGLLDADLPLPAVDAMVSEGSGDWFIARFTKWTELT